MFRSLILALTVFIVVLTASTAVATITDVARCIQISATVSRTPPTITLSWPNLPEATHSFLVYRKLRQGKSWGNPIATLPIGSTSYADTNVVVGDAYEYMILGSSTSAAQEVYETLGYIYAGLDFPMIDQRGKLILIVDNTYAAALDNELSRLQQDLTGDGWTVIRHDVSRTQTVTSVKQLIVADYQADPANVKAVFLFGRIPVPYSGNCSANKEENAVGAREADSFYADMDGVWTDTLVNHTGTSFDSPRLDNVPGDGKYDQSDIPTDTELQIGRVDLSNMPSFTQGEQSLLKQYLDKDHNFRTGGLPVGRAGKVRISNYASPVSGYRNFAAFFGASNVTASSNVWFPPSASSYLWGSTQGDAGVHNNTYYGFYFTSDFVTDPKVVFTIMGAAAIDDWDYPDDLLRAPLCTPTYGLGCMAAGPYDLIHTMSLGDTIGSAMWLKQNYTSFLYQTMSRVTDLQRDDERERNVWIDWMGDPTLRLNPVLPPSGLTATTPDATTVSLTWTASTDTSIQGYLVYRAKGFGPFARLTASPIAATSYTDSGVATGTYSYMVRAVKLETNGSGTYYNPSQGVFQTVNAGSSAPAVALVSPLNQAGFLPSATVVIRASVNPGYTGSVDFYNGADKIGTAMAAPYTYQWSGVAAGTYTLTAQVSDANGTTTSEPVTISVAPLPYELTAPWLQADVGATGLAGSASIASGNFAMTGAGVGISGSADAFHAVYQPLNADGSIVAKVNSVASPGSAGVFIRDSLSAGSQGAALCISPTGTVTLSKRLSPAGAVTTETDPSSFTIPYWLKLTRAGDTVTAYRSSDGGNWVQVGTPATISMGATPDVGLVSFGGASGVSCASTFSNVSAVSPLLPAWVVWRGPYEGDTFIAGSSTVTWKIRKPDSPDNMWKTIAFYDGATLIATGSGRSTAHTIATAGQHTLKATVTDYLGVTGANTVNVIMNPAGSTPPTVALTSVMEGQVFAAPCDVVLTANATAASGKTISRVDFYSDGTLIGTSTSAPYSFTWVSVQPPSIHAVTARAVDSAGVVTQSAMVYLYFNTAQAVATTKLSSVKALPDASSVCITSPKVVTVASSRFSDGSYYIEEPDRTAGMKVIGGSVTLWDGVTLTGTLSTDANGEKRLLVSSIDSRASADPVFPLGMANRTLSASGLLVRVWGKITSKAIGSFVINDGSGTPVTVDVSGLASPVASLPDMDAYVGVTGPAGYAQGGVLAVKPRSDMDIQTY